MSVDFYNNNSEDFFKGTVEADMSETYREFEGFIDKSFKILDLGCGSGRDSKYFLENGYEVLSVDFSSEMVKKATELTGQNALYLDMTKMEFKDEFGAIWACASILHIPKLEIPSVLSRCYRALKKDGILYMSFKYGEGEISRGGRNFSNFTEDSFSKVLDDLNLFQLIKFWKTSDVRPDRPNEFWLNVIVKK